MRICSVFIFVCSVSVCLLLCSVCCLCFLCYALLVFCGLFLRTAPSHAFSFSHSSALSPLFLTFLSLFLCLFLSLCGLEIICSAVWWDTPSYLRWGKQGATVNTFMFLSLNKWETLVCMKTHRKIPKKWMCDRHPRTHEILKWVKRGACSELKIIPCISWSWNRSDTPESFINTSIKPLGLDTGWVPIQISLWSAYGRLHEACVCMCMCVCLRNMSARLSVHHVCAAVPKPECARVSICVLKSPVLKQTFPWPFSGLSSLASERGPSGHCYIAVAAEVQTV